MSLSIEVLAFSAQAIAIIETDAGGRETRHPIDPEPASNLMGKVRITAGQVEKFDPGPTPEVRAIPTAGEPPKVKRKAKPKKGKE